MPKIRVLIVDDSVVIRRLLSDCLASDAEIEVAGTAPSGAIALSKIEQVNPDVITLDIEMEGMDGLETLVAIRKRYPKLPVIMFSTLSERGATKTLDALSMGANDYVTKPANVGSVSVGMLRIREELIPKIKALCQKMRAQSAPVVVPVAKEAPKVFDFPAITSSPVEILAIGVSTGGPNALAQMLPRIASNFPAPIVIVQHMPPLFTKMLAERLGAVTGRAAREGEAGAVLRPGEIWVAPGGFHMEVERVGNENRLRLHEEEPENSCRPAVDVLFRSVAKTFGNRALAVVLTGMGYDGKIGAELIRDAGGRVLAQDEATSVVWGMPGAVAQAGLAESVLALDELATEINRRACSHARPPTALQSPQLAHQS